MMGLNKKIHVWITGAFPRLHYLLVKRDPYLLNAFDAWAALHPLLHERFKLISYAVVLKINVQFLFRKLFCGWKPCLTGAESALSPMPDPAETAAMLEKFDVVSFDVFDTLLLRPFATPQTLFTLVGEQLGIPGFALFRQRVQDELDRRRQKSGQDYSLNELYRILADRLGISATDGAELEKQTETELAFAHSYWLKVFQQLKKNGKILIAVSDMYLASETIAAMLKKNGFDGFDRLFVSHEEGCTKAGGGMLFRIVQKCYPGKKIIHVGDDAVADVAAARAAGLPAFHAKNVNTFGNPYRVTGLTPLLNSAYSGIVNAHLHNGLNVFSPVYEYGYVYGGLLISGFCRWIYDYAENVRADVIWFIARDGYILKKTFQKLYPEKKSRYFLWSRTAALKACAELDKSAWKSFFILNKASAAEKYTVQECLRDAGLPELARRFSKGERDLNAETLPELEAFVDDNWPAILQTYCNDREALRQYLRTMLGDAQNVVIVDIGYSGTCPVALQRILKKEVPAVNAHLLMGIYGRVKIQPDLLLSPEIHPYFFGENYNADLWRDYSEDSNGTNSLRLEMFFSAPHAYTNGFATAGRGGFQVEWGHYHRQNDAILRQIHQGILDFALEFHRTFEKYPWLLRVCGRDAVLPFAAIKKQHRYFKKFFVGFVMDSLPKNDPKNELTCNRTYEIR